MYKVFLKDRIIYLTDNSKYKPQSIIDKQLLTYSKIEQLKIIIQNFETDLSLNSIYIYKDDCDKLFADFKSCFKLIEAAGGLVRNNDGQLLIINRLDVWDLPKGKVEKNENFKDAAIREVKEECGINGLEITSELPKTFHIYYIKRKRILKRTHWYNMLYKGNEILKPQLEEDITEATWIDTKKIKDITNNTYLSLIDTFMSATK